MVRAWFKNWATASSHRQEPPTWSTNIFFVLINTVFHNFSKHSNHKAFASSLTSVVLKWQQTRCTQSWEMKLMTEVLSAKVRAVTRCSHYIVSFAELWRESVQRVQALTIKHWTSADRPPRCPQNCSANQFYIAGLQVAFTTLISLLWNRCLSDDSFTWAALLKETKHRQLRMSL